MPTYVYRREDGSVFELEQRITEPALTHDPETGQKVERVIAGAGLLFKGSGFYLTDYARASGGKKESGTDGASETAGTKADSAPATSTNESPAPSKPAKPDAGGGSATD